MRVAEGDAAWVCARSGKPRLTNGVVCDLDVLEVTCRPVVRPASAERESRQVWTCMRTDGRAKISIALEVPHSTAASQISILQAVAVVPQHPQSL